MRKKLLCYTLLLILVLTGVSCNKSTTNPLLDPEPLLTSEEDIPEESEASQESSTEPAEGDWDIFIPMEDITYRENNLLNSPEELFQFSEIEKNWALTDSQNLQYNEITFLPDSEDEYEIFGTYSAFNPVSKKNIVRKFERPTNKEANEDAMILTIFVDDKQIFKDENFNGYEYGRSNAYWIDENRAIISFIRFAGLYDTKTEKLTYFHYPFDEPMPVDENNKAIVEGWLEQDIFLDINTEHNTGFFTVYKNMDSDALGWDRSLYAWDLDTNKYQEFFKGKFLPPSTDVPVHKFVSVMMNDKENIAFNLGNMENMNDLGEDVSDGYFRANLLDNSNELVMTTGLDTIFIVTLDDRYAVYLRSGQTISQMIVFDSLTSKIIFKEAGKYFSTLNNKFLAYSDNDNLYIVDFADKTKYNLTLSELEELYPSYELDYGVIATNEGAEPTRQFLDIEKIIA